MFLNCYGEDWREFIKNPAIGEMYFDGLTMTLWEYVKLGDYPPEWVNVTPYQELK